MGQRVSINDVRIKPSEFLPPDQRAFVPVLRPFGVSKVHVVSADHKPVAVETHWYDGQTWLCIRKVKRCPICSLLNAPSIRLTGYLAARTYPAGKLVLLSLSCRALWELERQAKEDSLLGRAIATYRKKERRNAEQIVELGDECKSVVALWKSLVDTARLVENTLAKNQLNA